MSQNRLGYSLQCRRILGGRNLSSGVSTWRFREQKHSRAARKRLHCRLIGLGYRWKEIYVCNLHKGFTETRLEDVDLFKTQP